MKHIKKISILIIMLLLLSLNFSNYSNASDIDKIFSSADEFLGKGNSVGSTINPGQLQSTSDFMYKLLLAIGILVMFMVGTIIGIKFMLSSAEDKAKVKESLVPYVVGCFVIFGAFTIWSMAVKIGEKVVGSKEVASYEVFVKCSDCNLNMEKDGFWNWKCTSCQKTVSIAPTVSNGEFSTDSIQDLADAIKYQCNSCGHIQSSLGECGGCGRTLKK